MISANPVFGSTRRTWDTLVGGMPMLNGGPNGKYMLPVLSVTMYFQPCATKGGMSSYTTTGAGILSRLASALS